MTTWLDEELDEAADALDSGPPAFDLLGRLAAEGFTRVGVPRALGGDGGAPSDVAAAVAQVAQHSVAAAFVLWSQRSYAELVVQGDNPELCARELPALLDGRRAGGVGLSNAMKFLCGIESLDLAARPLAPPDGESWRVDGVLPWVTNLRAQGFSVAAAVQPAPGGPLPVYALRSDQPGVRRSPDLPLIGLRGCDVAAVRLAGVLVGSGDRLHADLNLWLPQVRPLFLGAQCGMSIGLARASLFAAQRRVGRRQALRVYLDELILGLETDVAELLQGLDDGRFGADPAALFRLRLALALHVQEALALELRAWGGQACLEGQAPGFARRWREAAFIPILTPSVAQLEMQLLKK